jgi:hypothetical protein
MAALPGSVVVGPSNTHESRAANAQEHGDQGTRFEKVKRPAGLVRREGHEEPSTSSFVAGNWSDRGRV